jgi:hypothetical protein
MQHENQEKQGKMFHRIDHHTAHRRRSDTNNLSNIKYILL